MSKCLWCKKTVTKTSKRNGRPLKYCSKECSNEFYAERDRNKLREKLDGPTPCTACGTLVERFLSNKPKKYCSDKCAKDPKWLERSKKNAWIDENCISKEEVAREIGISTSTVTNRMKKLNLKEQWKIVDGLNYVFVKKIDVDPIKNFYADKAVPESCITREELCKNLGLSTDAFKRKLDKIQKATGNNQPEVIMQDVYREDLKQLNLTALYNKKEVTEFIYKNQELTFNCAQCDNEFQTFYSTKKYCSKACAKKANIQRRKASLAKDWISTLEVYSVFEKEFTDAKRFRASKNYLNTNMDHYNFQKFGGKRYFPRSQFDSFLEQFREEFLDHVLSIESSREEAKAEAKKRQSAKIIRRSSDQNSWEYKERLWLLHKSQSLIECKEEHGIDSDRFANLYKLINKRTSYLTDYWERGIIANFECTSCSETKPFYEFYSNLSTLGGRGFDSKCSSCASAAQKNTAETPGESKDWVSDGKKKLRTLVALSIRNKINKDHGSYKDGFGVRPCWRAIRTKCGYTHEQLVDHIEKQFTPNMNWGNQRTPKSPGSFGWHLDHITPHSSFNYTSFDDADFAKCWSLDNLQPLQARMNMQKADKNLYLSHFSSFRHGVKSSEIYKSGIWKFLPYTNLDAKKYIEKQFEAGMTWENHGAFWQIDHIDPLAHLAYLGESDENFKKAWRLKNLQPLTRSDNASKSSIFENELWIHNYQEGAREQEVM